MENQSARASRRGRLKHLEGQAGHVRVQLGVVRHVQKHPAAHVETGSAQFAQHTQPAALVGIVAQEAGQDAAQLGEVAAEVGRR